MRIIAGKFRGRKLKSPPDAQTRPTSDRLRETLFNIISPRIIEARFLDLCAGSGAVGIEAISRGATHTTFVEISSKICSLIETNLNLCRVEKECFRLVCNDSTKFLKREQKISKEGWDIVFFDPPYEDEYTDILSLFAEPDSKLLNDDPLLIIEHRHTKILPDSIEKLERRRIIKQGDSCLSFYEIQV